MSFEPNMPGIHISLEGKRALITGAANGIGAAIARLFAQAGARLLLVDIDKEKLENLWNELQAEEKHHFYHLRDLSKKEEIDELWKDEMVRKCDILVNNAGIYPFRDFLSLDEEMLNKVMSLNLYSVIWMCQHFIRANKKKGGIIVNIGSIEAIMPFKKGLSQYSLSKVGVITLTRDLAREFASQGFRVNAIIPGGIITKGTKTAALHGLTHLEFGLVRDAIQFKLRIPAGRLGKPIEVAQIALVLASDLASYVHGALIPVDGGFLSN